MHAKINRSLNELGAVKLFEIAQKFCHGDGRNLVALRTRHPCQAFEGEPHVARFGEDGLDRLMRLRIQVFGFVEERRIAKDDGERVVELSRDIPGKLPETNEFLSLYELLEHHGLAADRLQTRSKHLKRQQVHG